MASIGNVDLLELLDPGSTPLAPLQPTVAEWCRTQRNDLHEFVQQLRQRIEARRTLQRAYQRGKPVDVAGPQTTAFTSTFTQQQQPPRCLKPQPHQERSITAVADLSGNGSVRGQLRALYMAAAPLTSGNAFLQWAKGRRQLECSALGSCPGSVSADAIMTQRHVALALPWPMDWVAKLATAPTSPAGINPAESQQPGAFMGALGANVEAQPGMTLQPQLLTDFHNSTGISLRGQLSRRRKQADSAKSTACMNDLKPDGGKQTRTVQHVMVHPVADEKLTKTLQQPAEGGKQQGAAKHRGAQMVVAELGSPDDNHLPGSCTSNPGSRDRQAEGLHKDGYTVVSHSAQRITHNSARTSHRRSDAVEDDTTLGLGGKEPAVIPGLQASFHVEHPLVGQGYPPTCHIKLRQQLSGGLSLSGAASFGGVHKYGPTQLHSSLQQSASLRDMHDQQTSHAVSHDDCRAPEASSSSSSSKSNSGRTCRNSHRPSQGAAAKAMAASRLSSAPGHAASAHEVLPCSDTSSMRRLFDTTQTADPISNGHSTTRSCISQEGQAEKMPYGRSSHPASHQHGSVGRWHVEGKKRVEGGRTLVLRAEGMSKGPWAPQLVKLSWHASRQSKRRHSKGPRRVPATAWLCVHRAKGISAGLQWGDASLDDVEKSVECATSGHITLGPTQHASRCNVRLRHH
ncbi:hypothetical protein WJX74_007765 [Apatococcus lobatus]|uniref:Uncharacterized protein n=1 Tax=Apatococcus lobatus TaxID=904363 RepID=A0AAW1Q5N4_9CHLO